jgi:putative TIM-barrel protein, nifR3 family
MTIQNITIEPTAALAPMAGVADRAFREICIAQGAGYVIGEMVSAKGLCYQSAKSAELLDVTDGQRPMAVQLFGDDPATMAEAARICMQYKPDIIDLNMGCPTPKIVNNGAGCALMKTPKLAGDIIRAVSGAVPLPVTVKIRKGWDDSSVNAVTFAKHAEQSGAAAIAIHGRTRAQMYAPSADWSIIAQVKQAVALPVIGNGDIASAEDAARMVAQTGCDLVMVGRGALGNPWLFAQIRAQRLGLPAPPAPTLSQRLELLQAHAALACQYKGEGRAMREMRPHCAWYLKGIRGAAAWRRQMMQITSLPELTLLCNQILAERQDAAEARQ